MGATTQLAAQTGCTEGAGLACLRAATLPALFAASEAVGAPFGPIVDGSWMPEQPRALYDRAEIARVPLLIGSNSDEGTAFTLDAASIANDPQYVTALERLAADPVEVQQVYPLSDFASAKNPYQAAFARAWGDSRLVCSTLDVAVRAQRAGSPVYMYNFDMPMDDVLGAAHAFEIGFVFGTIANPTPEQKAVSDRMQRYWTRFAETGDPNSAGEYPWPSFTQTANVRMSFAPTPSVIAEFRSRECNFWRTQYDKAF
jgi:para-nitrobenzyl esterase